MILEVLVYQKIKYMFSALDPLNYHGQFYTSSYLTINCYLVFGWDWDETTMGGFYSSEPGFDTSVKVGWYSNDYQIGSPYSFELSFLSIY